MKLRDLRNHYDSLDGIDKRILLKDLGVKMIRTHKQVRIEANEPLNQILNPELAKIPSEPEFLGLNLNALGSGTVIVGKIEMITLLSSFLLQFAEMSIIPLFLHGFLTFQNVFYTKSSHPHGSSY